VTTFRVAAAQFSRRLGDKDFNVDRALRLVEDGASRGAELIGLPELFNTGYFPGAPELSNEYFGWAEPVDGPTVDWASSSSRRSTSSSRAAACTTTRRCSWGRRG
jgi:predicted amidohydrolase